MFAFNSIRKFLNKYNFLIYTFLTILLLGACFFESFVFISVAYILFIGIFIDETYLLGILVFIYPYIDLFSSVLIPYTNMFDLFRFILIFNILIRHTIVSIKEKAKLNLKIVITFLVILVYLIIPRPNNKISFFIILYCLFDLLLVYILVQKRLKINYFFIIEIFAISLIISCLMSFLRPLSVRLQEIIVEHRLEMKNIYRFSGLVGPNHLGMLVVTICSLLCISKYLNRINNLKFVLYNSILVYFGVQTISRSFALSIFIMYSTFLILYLTKYRKKGLIDLVYLLSALFLVLILSINKIAILFERFSYNQIYNQIDGGSNSELWYEILNGEVRYDPGRKEIWRLYLNDIISSPMVILFGRGIARPYIGKMAPHNHFIEFIWQNGVFGIVILVIYIFSILDFKKLSCKGVLEKLYSLIFLLPIGLIFLIEKHPLGRLIYSIFIIIIYLQDKKIGVKDLNNNEDIKNEKIKEGSHKEI